MTNAVAVASASAWYSDPDFVAARQRTVPAGGVGAYVETPPVGRVPGDVTSFIYGQATWSDRHLPNILYRLRPNADWELFKADALPYQKSDAQGRPMYERWPTDPTSPRPLLDFEVLPDRIGTQEHWWRFEAWRRLDPRIRWSDISMRMAPLPHRPSDQLLRSRVSRPRIRFFMLSWHTGSRQEATNDAILRALSQAQVRANTTRGSTPGLIDPGIGRAGGRVYRVGEDEGDDTQSEEEGEESGSQSEEDIDDLIVNGTGGKADWLIAGHAGNGDKATSQEVDLDGGEEEEIKNELEREKDTMKEEEQVDEDEDEEKQQREKAQGKDNSNDKFHDASEGPPLKRRRIESSQATPSTTNTTAADYTDAFGEDRPLLRSRLSTPTFKRPSPHSYIKHAVGAHGPLGLPADSRDFDPDGNYLSDSNIGWQINETARYGKEKDREIERKRRCPDPRGP